MKLAGVLGLVLATGCSVGDDDPPPDPTGRVCAAVLSTRGMFAPDTAHPRPIDPDTGMPTGGCWPYGMWTFTATVESNDCAAAPTPLPEYQIRVDYSTDPMTGDPIQTYVYPTEPTSRHTVKGSQGGVGDCEGELAIYSADGKTVWLLKPAVFIDAVMDVAPANAILGDGEYTVYNDNQWPFEGQ